MDKRLEKIFKVYDRQRKVMARMFRNATAYAHYMASQEKFVEKDLLPPMLGVAYADYSKQNLLILCNNQNYFETKDVDVFLQYFDDKIIAVFNNDNATQNEKYTAFARVVCMGYMVDDLIEILLERDSIVDSDKFMQHAKSHRSALINFINDVQARHEKHGKVGLSGSNLREIEEIRDMAEAMLKGIWIGEWYTAYTLAYYKFLCNRMGCEPKDWE